ncbi:MAG TPA: TerD family protein [Spirillospora sp.]
MPDGPRGDGAAAARQFDAALMSAGFKLSRDAMTALSGLSEKTVLDMASLTLPIVREMVGDHVHHNVYFKDFPHNVPDTMEFWLGLLKQALFDPVAESAAKEPLSEGVLNLLALPGYGTYQHSYEEMLAAHDELIPAAGDRVTVLGLGDDLVKEGERLYLRLAGSSTPLREDELEALRELAEYYVEGPHPEQIPVRENRAVINTVRLMLDEEPLVDTVTDVLRLACSLSDGDVSLAEPTRFMSLPRSVRRSLLAALDRVVRTDRGKLGDVPAYRERWKRLGERLHPHEYPQWTGAAEVFAVARGEKRAPSIAAKIEARFAAGDVVGAARVAKTSPGMLFRAVDRLLREASPEEQDAVLDEVESVVDRVSGRVLLSTREYLLNRPNKAGKVRLFTNRLGRGVAVPDERPPLAPPAKARLTAMLNKEIRRRLPSVGHLVIDPDMLDVALPLSGKASGTGFGVLPRGSLSPVNDGDVLRFFIYWHQRELRTDFDLSTLLLDKDYRVVDHMSFSNLRVIGGVHSGDITEAPTGASEFIDLSLDRVKAHYIVPQVDIYTGEGFNEVKESFFGFMVRGRKQKGRPFEPRTVRMKSDLRGPGRIALPIVFMRGHEGGWRAKWLHLHLTGSLNFNRVETNQATTAALVRGLTERQYLTVDYLKNLIDAEETTLWDGKSVPDGPVTFIGFAPPEGLHPDSWVLTPENLADLIPE